MVSRVWRTGEFVARMGLVTASTLLAVPACGGQSSSGNPAGSAGEVGAGGGSADAGGGSADAGGGTAGAGGGTAGAGDGGFESVEQFCVWSAGHYCAQLEACAPPIAMTFYFGDGARCRALVAQSCRAFSANPAVASFEKRHACYAAIYAQSCDDWYDRSHVPEACLPPASGTKAAGAGCAYDAECSSGVCVTTEYPCGHCTAEGASQLGGPCGGATQCALGLQCSSQGVCTGYGAEGAACEYPYEACAGKLRCVGGRCSAPLPLGADCAALAGGEDACDAASYEACDLPDTGKCVKISIVNVNEPCNGISYCSNAYCDWHSNPFVWTCKPYLAEGESCALVGDAIDPCLWPSYCQNGKCTVSRTCG